MNPQHAAERMEEAERARGIEPGDSCLNCANRVFVFGEPHCLGGLEMTRPQFHRCAKFGKYEKQSKEVCKPVDAGYRS